MCLLYVEIKGMSTKGGSILAGKLRLVFKTDKRHKVIDTAVNEPCICCTLLIPTIQFSLSAANYLHRIHSFFRANFQETQLFLAFL